MDIYHQSILLNSGKTHCDKQFSHLDLEPTNIKHRFNDITCHNQAFVAEISCRVRILMISGKIVNLVSYNIFFTFLCLTNPKLCSSQQPVVLNLHNITEPRKQNLKS